MHLLGKIFAVKKKKNLLGLQCSDIQNVWARLTKLYNWPKILSPPHYRNGVHHTVEIICLYCGEHRDVSENNNKIIYSFMLIFS